MELTIIQKGSDGADESTIQVEGVDPELGLGKDFIFGNDYDHVYTIVAIDGWRGE